MSTSVGTKSRKKQPSLAAALPPRLEQAMGGLENTCMQILYGEDGASDSERMYWQQRFKNIATPVSLALNEYKGPRRFHYHYRHRDDDEAVLRPVMEPSPIDMLAQVCEYSLAECHAKLVGIRDERMLKTQRILEHALQIFLQRYREYKAA